MINKIRILLEMVKIEHTLFAMPFLFSGAILGSFYSGYPITGKILFWITIGLFSARTAAMSLNRLIDRDIDGQNPRTADRALPAGLVSVIEVKVLILINLIILLAAAYSLNELTLKLYPLAVVSFFIYPLMKRYTYLAHVILGTALGIAPLGAWVAVTGTIDPPSVILALAVTFWVAGFDVIYAVQDIEFDRKTGLHSVPAKFGLDWALKISSLLHSIMFVFLVWLFFSAGLGNIFAIGLLIILGLLIYEHRLISPENLEKVGVAFFNINTLVGFSFFIFIFLDVYI